jgi:type II secretory pathway pseudopilin PulG
VTGGRFRRPRPLREEGAYALPELITVMLILSVVLSGLTALFISATRAEVDMRERFDAQQEIRLALDALRREVHCASTITQTGPSPTVTLTLATGCPSGSGTVTWCTVNVASNRFRLFRKTGSTCDSTGKLYADYLTPKGATNCPPNMCAFSYTAPTTTSRAKLHVELPVDVAPADNRASYRLVDDLVLRNSGFA